MPSAYLLQETSESDTVQSLLSELLHYANTLKAHSLDLRVNGYQRTTLVVRPSYLPPSSFNPAQETELCAQANILAQGRLLHAAVRHGTARLWMQADTQDPGLAWLSPPRVGRRHPLLPVWQAMADGTDYLLGASENSAHRRLLQATLAAHISSLPKLIEKFTHRPVRLWRRGPEGIALYSDAMADGFEVVRLPIS